MMDRAYAGETERSESGLIDQAMIGLNEANVLHSEIDELEVRIFGPEPRTVADGSGPSGKPTLAVAVKGTRERIESASSRLSRIISRL